LQHLTDGAQSLWVLREWQVLLYLVSVATTLPQLADATGLGEIVDDVVGAAFSDAQFRGDVAQARRRIAGDAQTLLKVFLKYIALF
jgi:hypothetical protein